MPYTSSSQLISIFNVECDMEAKVCLSTFRNIRDSLSKELDLPMESFENISEEYDRNKVKLSSHEMIMVEVKSYL